jgi:hypothetical protein
MEVIIIILLIIIAVLLFQKAKIQKENKVIIQEGNRKINSKNSTISEQSDRISELSKYQPIIDIQEELEKRRSESNAYFAVMRQDASTFIKVEREKGKRLKELAEVKLEEAHQISDKIIADAKIKAEEIAGSAYHAKNNAEQFTETAKAMENIIKGYGDEYLIPGESLIDELAEDYDHTEAGKDLANIRSLIKSMIKNGMVADCDYSETKRRIAAIDFVIDAFNGKVDTVMSRVRHDNYGKLLQKLKDAFRIVNHNGQPFRNARILPRYYDVIEDQLKLSVTVSEIKKKDREEQRVIREEMREEEKARREYEKALKQSQKEEKLIAKALKEAEARFKQANESDRVKYELELQQLQEDLGEAILKGQRAMSMAQQTKMGHVYVISNVGSFGENIFKIGLTRRLEPLDRVKELGDASVPFSFDVHAMIHSDNAPSLERELQLHFKDFQVNKVNPRKEFFNLSLTEIKNKVESMDLNTHWTMKSDAKEYRESLQIAEQKMHTIIKGDSQS